MRTAVRLVAVAAIAIGIALVPRAFAAESRQTTHTFSGSCDIAGPISPNPGITVVPKPGAMFSFHGTGQCVGLLDKRTRERTMDSRIDFVDVTTAFDTCELGPDYDLHGTLTIAPPRGRAARFPIVLNLTRIAVVGPFTLTANGGGEARGRAMFSPDDPGAAIVQCAGAKGGLTAAKLSASFDTTSPLVGVTQPRPR